MAEIIFFGTHDFGAAMLEALLNAGHKISLVVTQPDRPIGRKQEIATSPVKKLAILKNLKYIQPESLKDFEFNYSSDLIVVCQYGLIIPLRILITPKFGALNVHTSLLPKYRGASPVQSAIINGETETGVTIMLMDEKMDHGPILSQNKIAINPDETYPELRSKMAPIAADLLTKTVKKWLKNEIRPITQNESSATFCKIYTRDDGRISWSDSASTIYNLFRGLNPWPGIWTTWNNQRLKLLKIKPTSENIPPGIVSIIKDRLLVGTGIGSVEILDIQLEGKNQMTAKAFITGYSQINGSKLS